MKSRNPSLLAALLLACRAAAAAGYPRGCYAMWPILKPLAPEIASNAGFAGVYLQFVWPLIEKEDGVYDWSLLDARIAEARRARLKVVLAIRDGPMDAPAWLDSDPRVRKITVVASNPYLKSYCRQVEMPLFWDPVFHEKRKRFIRALGKRYSAEPGLVAVTAAFANAHTDDWWVPHERRKVLAGKCGVDFDNERQWLANGYSTPKMLSLGKDIIGTTAAAFPNQALKLPLGNHGKALDAARLLKGIVAWAMAKYPDRFYVQVNRLDVGVPEASSPSIRQAGAYGPWSVFALLARSPLSGLQMTAAATNGERDRCRQNRGAAPCPPYQVLERSIGIALSYRPTFLEFWPEDSANPELAPIFKRVTLEQ